jgi:GTPase SAR1 family protein
MIRVYVPDATILLVGCKIDLRTTPASVARLERKGTSAITSSEAQGYVKDVGAAQYIECSAITQDGRLTIQSSLRCHQPSIISLLI